MMLRDAQERESRSRAVLGLAAGILACAVTARALLGLAVPAGWRWTLAASGPFRHPWLGSPADVVATALLVIAIVGLLFDLLERCRTSRPRFRPPRLGLWPTLALTGVLAGLVLSAHARLLAALVQLGTGVSLTRVPTDPAQLALMIGVLCANAAVVWLVVTLIRLAGSVSPVRRDD